MILHRKTPQLKVRTAASPVPPFWAATSLSPYGPRRATPMAIDYLAMSATAVDRSEVTVCEDAAAALAGVRLPPEPVLIDAAEGLETTFRRGADALAWCTAHGLAALHLVSTTGSLPEGRIGDEVVTITAWPPDEHRLEEFCAAAGARGLRWGVLVPVVFPITTDSAVLEAIADTAARHGAAFFAAAGVDPDAPAKQAIARQMELSAADDRYALLFHSRVEPLHVAAERHAAALAAERGLADFVTPPRWAARSNWNAAVLLTLTATRMLAMEFDVDLAGRIARSARAVAALDKPVARIAESASLSIVEALDETSAGMLTEWLGSGRASFAEFVAGQWRLRRG